MSRADFLKLRLRRTAAIGRVRTAVCKTAGRRRLNRGGNLTLQKDTFLAVIQGRNRDCRQ